MGSPLRVFLQASLRNVNHDTSSAYVAKWQIPSLQSRCLGLAGLKHYGKSFIHIHNNHRPLLWRNSNAQMSKLRR